MENFNLNDIIGHGMSLPGRIPHIKISYAIFKFVRAFDYLLNQQGRSFIKKKGYILIAGWLCDNENKGLLLMGPCSLGKTFIARYVIPAILL